MQLGAKTIMLVAGSASALHPAAHPRKDPPKKPQERPVGHVCKFEGLLVVCQTSPLECE